VLSGRIDKGIRFLESANAYATFTRIALAVIFRVKFSGVRRRQE
jgi:hypothetical protein